jgi:hypothetical protein
MIARQVAEVADEQGCRTRIHDVRDIVQGIDPAKTLLARREWLLNRDPLTV